MDRQHFSPVTDCSRHLISRKCATRYGASPVVERMTLNGPNVMELLERVAEREHRATRPIVSLT